MVWYLLTKFHPQVNTLIPHLPISTNLVYFPTSIHLGSRDITQTLMLVDHKVRKSLQFVNNCSLGDQIESMFGYGGSNHSNSDQHSIQSPSGDLPSISSLLPISIPILQHLQMTILFLTTQQPFNLTRTPSNVRRRNQDFQKWVQMEFLARGSPIICGNSFLNCYRKNLQNEKKLGI